MRVVILLAIFGIFLALLGLLYVYGEIRDRRRFKARLASRPTRPMLSEPRNEIWQKNDLDFLRANGVSQEVLDEISLNLGKY